MSVSINTPRKTLVTFTRLNNTNRLVWCRFTQSYLLEQKDKTSMFWSEKYITPELATFIKSKYSK